MASTSQRTLTITQWHCFSYSIWTLNSLILTAAPGSESSKFLQHLTVPSLKRLELRTTEHTVDKQDLIDLIRRSVCKIEVFKFWWSLEEHFLFEVLPEIPYFQRLSMTGSSLFLELLVHLTNDTFLPNLWMIECSILSLGDTLNALNRTLGESEFNE